MVERDEGRLCSCGQMKNLKQDLPPFRNNPGPTFAAGNEQNAGDMCSRFLQRISLKF